MPNAGLRALVPPIASEPLPNGLLGGCVDVVTTNDMHELNGTDMITSACAGTMAWQECPAADPDNILPPWVNPGAKLFDRPEAASFEPVTAHAGVECSTFGVSFPEAQQRALEQLRLGEQLTVEAFFMARGMAAMALGNDLTPAGGAVHIVQGVALLEAWLAAEFGGSGLVHAPVAAGTLLSMNRVFPFPSAETCTETLAGNGLILGAGYAANTGPFTAPLTPGTAAPAGEAWLYVTPPLRIRRDAPSLTLAREWQGVNTVTNDRRASAESTFVVEAACFTAAAVRVSLDPCFCTPAVAG